MTTKHVVQAGETLLAIANIHRFVRWEAIWEHPDNAALREKREDPMVLAPGDEVAIPDKEQRWERVATNQRHVFQLTALDARLRLLVADELGVPLTGMYWRLEVGERERCRGRVQARGLVECRIKPEWREATLTVSDVDLKPIDRNTSDPGRPKEAVEAEQAERAEQAGEEPPPSPRPRVIYTWNLEIGELEPIDTVRGVQSRLASLGLLDGELVSGELTEPTKKGIEAFQRRYGLPVTGAADDAELHAALLELVGA